MNYTDSNSDNIAVAILGLDIFMKSWCMNCSETERLQKPMFRCGDCVFNVDSNICVIKQFAFNHLAYRPDNFGSMSY